MELSIIIINWNTKDLLLRCLASIDQKGKGIQKEVLVIDNGSMDGSPAAVRKRFPEVVLIQNPINLGFAAANNQGLNRSKGRYVLLISNPPMILRLLIRSNIWLLWIRQIPNYLLNSTLSWVKDTGRQIPMPIYPLV